MCELDSAYAGGEDSMSNLHPHLQAGGISVDVSTP